MKIKAFTLSEVMVCLCILAVLIAIVLPAINACMVYKNKQLFRKAYNMLEKSVQSMSNDDYWYPANDEDNLGFAQNITSIDDANSDDKIYTKNDDYNDTGIKFCEILARKLNTSDTVTGYNVCDWRRNTGTVGNYSPNPTRAKFKHGSNTNTALLSSFMNNKSDNGTGYIPAFTTNDGIQWYLPLNPIYSPNEAACSDGTCIVWDMENDSGGQVRCPVKDDDGKKYTYTCVFIDVNGIPSYAELPPNLHSINSDPVSTYEENGPNVTTGVKDVDRFVVIVNYDGRMEPHTLGGNSPASYILGQNSIF